MEATVFKLCHFCTEILPTLFLSLAYLGYLDRPFSCQATHFFNSLPWSHFMLPLCQAHSTHTHTHILCSHKAAWRHKNHSRSADVDTYCKTQNRSELRRCLNRHFTKTLMVHAPLIIHTTPTPFMSQSLCFCQNWLVSWEHTSNFNLKHLLVTHFNSLQKSSEFRDSRPSRTARRPLTGMKRLLQIMTLFQNDN